METKFITVLEILDMKIEIITRNIEEYIIEVKQRLNATVTNRKNKSKNRNLIYGGKLNGAPFQ